MPKFNRILFLAFIIYIFLAGQISAQTDINKVNDLLNSAKEKTKTYPEKIKIYDSVIYLSEKINYLQGKADALNLKGDICLKIGEYLDATNAFYEEFKLREDNPGWKNSSIGTVYAKLGESYRAIGNYDLSLDFLNKSLKIAEEKKDEKELAYIYDRFAAVYHEISYRREDTASSFKAIDFAKKSIELNKKLNTLDLQISSYNIIGAAYAFQGNANEALKYLFIALEYAERDSTCIDIPLILNNMSYVYTLKGDYKKATECSLRGCELSKKTDIKVYILISNRSLSNIYSKTGDYKTAYGYLLEAHDLYLTMFNEKKTAEIYGLQKKYENELTLQLEESNKNRRILLGLAFIVIVVVVSILIYLKHKEQVNLNKILEAKNNLILSQKEELSRANRAKDKFFSILSHDIRNPLNGILGFSGILESDFNVLTDKEKKDFIGYVKTSSESLFKLIEKVLLWSRLQSGRVDINKEKINLCEIVSGVINLQKANTLRKGLTIESEVPDWITVFTDKNILDMVLRNLLDNAIKFTEAGGKICIKGEIKNNSVLISVSDTGVGIGVEDLEKIFQIEHKKSSKGTDSEEGTGLGLIICKDMLNSTGTELKVISAEGEGSTFYFELPSDRD
jgi:signal transduction histidine kinase/tetratricopeptide (TPR) repeat protein